MWEKGFSSCERKYYDKLVTSGSLAILLEWVLSQEIEIRSVLEARGGHHIHHRERVEV